MRSHAWSLVLLAACSTVEAPTENPNDGMFQDFQDGKFDAAGHPLNARVVDAKDLCGGAAIASTGCKASLPGGAQHGDMQVNARIRVKQHPTSGAILTIKVGGSSETLTVSRLRGRSSWIDFPVSWSSDGSDVQIELLPAAGAKVELQYVEVFPRHFGLVVSPGSGVFDDDGMLKLELPKGHKLDKLSVDGLDVDLAKRLDTLIAQGTATRTTTTLRTVIDVSVGDLLPERGDVAELRINSGNDSARAQLRRTSHECNFEGTGAKKVLVTGFQPFPADGWHENVSAVAVTAMNPNNIGDARVMRMVLPVEYDRAAATIADAIDRCAPDIVISFGQGGGAIALEEVAYNLQDTGEVSGGVPDNRGIIRAAQPIDEAADAERPTLLPIDEIESELVSIGESPQHSRDPGRYICNNVMFVDIGAMTSRGGRAGFIHLPYTTQFDDSTRARFGHVVEAAIRAAQK